MPEGRLTEAPSPRGVSLLPRDLIKALAIYLPGTPLIHNLHLKAKVRFPDRFFLLYCSSVTSKKKTKNKQRKKPKTNINKKKGQVSHELRAHLPPHPPGSDLRRSSSLRRAQSPAPKQTSQGGIPQPDKPGMPVQPCKGRLQFTRTSQEPSKQSPTAPQLKPALKSEKGASP